MNKMMLNINRTKYSKNLDEVVQSNEKSVEYRDFRIAEVYIEFLSEQTLIEVLTKEKVKKVLLEASHLFAVVIYAKSINTTTIDWNDAFSKIIVERNTSFLIEICQESKLKARFILDKTLVNEEPEKTTDDDESESNNDSDTDDDTDIDIDINAISFLKQKCEDVSLLSCNLELSDYDKSIKAAALNNDTILMRYLKTFDVKQDDKVHETMLQVLVNKSNVQTLVAYLDLPVYDNGQSLFSQTYLTKIATKAEYENGESLLCIAACLKGADMMKLMLRLGVDLEAEDNNSCTAADHAMRSHRYGNFKLLLQMDCPFKDNEEFKDFGSMEATQIETEILEILEILEERRIFHQAIKDKNELKIKEFRRNNPKLKFGYLFSTAAFTTAFQNKCNDTCATLLAENFYMKAAHVEMSAVVRRQISTIMQDKFKRNEFWLTAFLEANTKICFINDQGDAEYFKRIFKIYENLSKLDEVNELLKILEHSESFSITFDFVNKYINKTILEEKATDDGICYHGRGLIYVSVADKGDDEIAGLVAHELTHFAMHIMFDNDCKPYDVLDSKSEKEFKEIFEKAEVKAKVKAKAKALDENEDNINVVDRVFTNYLPGERCKELIVCVPQLIASKKRDILINEHLELLNFFYNNILKRAKELTSEPEKFRIQRRVQQLNEKFGHIEDIKKSNIWLSISRLNINIETTNCSLVTCSTPPLFLADFYKTIEPKNRNYFIYASAQNLSSPLKKSKIQHLWGLIDDITLVLNCENVHLSKDDQNTFKQGIKRRKIIVFGTEKGIANVEKLFAKVNRVDKYKIEYKWDDVHDASKLKLLNTEISFQDINIRLRDFNYSFNNIPLEKLVNGEKVIIERSKVVIENYDRDVFVDRNFKGYKNFNDFLTNAKNNKILLLSGDAGMGKSIILSHISFEIKKNDPTYWVLRVNLHEYYESFSLHEDSCDGIFKLFLQSDTCSDQEFAKELFAHCYEMKKVIILLDAVDEIAPTYLEQCKELLESLSNKENIQLWITTREQLTDELTKLLKPPSSERSFVNIHLTAYEISDQLKCITKLWQKKLKLSSVSQEVTDKLNYFANKVLKKITKPIFEQSSSVVGIPLLTKIIAEVYSHLAREFIIDGKTINIDVVEVGDIFDLFKEFLFTKIGIVSKEKGKFVEREKVENEVFGDNIIVQHEDIALQLSIRNNRFGNNDRYEILLCDFKQHRFSEKEREIVQRYGLITFGANGEPYFTHEVFVDFFVSLSICRTLKQFSRYDDLPRSKVELAISVMNETVDSFFVKIDRLQQQCKKRGLHSRQVYRKCVRIHQQLPLIHFLNGAVATLNEETETAVTQKSYSLSLDCVDLYQSEFIDILECLIGYDIHFLSHFYFQYINNHCCQRKDLLKLLSGIASERCSRYIVEEFFSNPEINEKITDEFYLCNRSDGINAFQKAFLNLPEKETDLLIDCIKYSQLKDSLTKRGSFNDMVRRNPGELFEESTLFIHTKIMDKLTLTDDEKMNNLQSIKGDFKLDYDCTICEHSFRHSMEMKWVALNRLMPSETNRTKINTSLFQKVVEIIFNQSNNNIVIQFYEWVREKFSEDGQLAEIIEETFINFFWRCTSENGIEHLLSFIRKEVVDLARVLIKNLKKIIDSIVSKPSIFGKALAIYQANLTPNEFETLLFEKEQNTGENLVSKVISQSGPIFDEFFDVIQKEYIQDKFGEYYNFDQSTHYIWHLVKDFSIYNATYTNRTLRRYESLFHLSVIKQAIQARLEGQSIFQAAARHQDMSMLRRVWNMSRKVLNDKELEEILSEDGPYFGLTEHGKKSKGFLLAPPGINNAHCESASFEYIPYERGQRYPENVIKINERFVGAIATKYNVDKFGLYERADGFLCEFIPHTDPDKWRITKIAIGLKKFEDETMDIDAEFEFLVAKGLSWRLLGSTQEETHFTYYSGYDHWLLKSVNDTLSCQLKIFANGSRFRDMNRGSSYLIFDDSSIINGENDIYLKREHCGPVIPSQLVEYSHFE